MKFRLHHPPTSISFPLLIILSRRYRRPTLYSANPLSTRLCFIRFMSTHPPNNKDEDKDGEKDVDENKDLMKNDSVQSLSYPHLPTPKLPTSTTPTQFQLYRCHHNPPCIVGRSVLSV